MDKISIKGLISSKNPKLLENKPKFLLNPAIKIIEKIFHIDEINEFIEKNNNKRDFEYIESVFDSLNFSYNFQESDLDKIPGKGRLIIISNHPLGALDGISIVHLVGRKRKDVKIVVNDLLLNLNNLNGVFLPVDLYNTKSQRQNLVNISKVMKEEGVVIFFPAGKVSRMKKFKIRDTKWNKGAVSIARKFNSPILPAFIDGRNSLLFYLVAWLSDNSAPFLLSREMYNKKNTRIKISFENLISNKIFEDVKDDKLIINKIKEQLYEGEEGNLLHQYQK